MHRGGHCEPLEMEGDIMQDLDPTGMAGETKIRGTENIAADQ
jgi:hypothetical protein